MFDIVIHNVTVFDHALRAAPSMNIGIANGVISEVGNVMGEGSVHVDATGCYLTPGLIDFHAHVFYRSSDFCMPADVGLLPHGVTTVVDAGSAGVANYECFHKTIVSQALLDIKAFLHVSSLGLPSRHITENSDPASFEVNRIAYMARKYSDTIKGLKVRQSKDIAGAFGLEPLKAAVRIGDKTGLPVSVHVTDSPGSVKETLDILRPGDIFCHVFHEKGNTIIGEDGKVLPEVLSARKRGVLFDMAHGSRQFSLKIAKAALEQDFLPDIVSSDLSLLSLYKAPAYSFSYIMSELLNLGMGFTDIVHRCSQVPAKLLGKPAECFCKPGQPADMALFRIVEKEREYRDCYGNTVTGTKMIKPEMTIKDGIIVFRQYDFL